jgi:hypothetical protein
MKKLFFAVAIAGAAFISGCNSAGSNDPKVVLNAFFDALSKKDIATARTLATESSKSMLDMMEMGMKMGKDDKKTDEKYDKSKMEFGEPKIEGDKATIIAKDKGTGEGTNFTLKKEGGKWKVAFDKSMVTDKIGEGMDKMKEGGNDVLNKMKDLNLDSLGDKLKDAGKMIEQNKDKIQDAAKKVEEALKKTN